MARITESELKSQIKSRKFSPVYLLYGDEDYLVRHYSEKITEETADGAFSDFNLSRFTENIDLSEVVNSAKMVPAMGNYRCAAVLNPDIAKFSDKELSELYKYLDNPNETSVILFYFIGAAPGGSSKAKKFISAIEKAGSVLKLDKRSESELVRMLCTGAGKRGCTLSARTARMLIDFCSSDMNALLCELEKLCAYRPGQEISEEDIKLLCPRTLNYDAFGMIREINAGNPGKAFSILNELFQNRQEPIAIFGALTYSYVNMYRILAAQKSGVSPDAFAKSVGIKNTYAFRRSERDARRLGTEKLTKSLEILDDCDRKFKLSATDNRIILEETLAKLFETAKA